MIWCVLPDYCNDLNAVWQVEEKLKADELFEEYVEAIIIVLEPEQLWHDGPYLTYNGTYIIRHAKAKQCCEAIIKVLERNENYV